MPEETWIPIHHTIEQQKREKKMRKEPFTTSSYRYLF